MDASKSFTLRKAPRRIALLSSSPNQRSTRLSQLELVGTKWSTKRGWRFLEPLEPPYAVAKRRNGKGSYRVSVRRKPMFIAHARAQKTDLCCTPGTHPPDSLQHAT